MWVPHASGVQVSKWNEHRKGERKDYLIGHYDKWTKATNESVLRRLELPSLSTMIGPVNKSTQHPVPLHCGIIREGWGVGSSALWDSSWRDPAIKPPLVVRVTNLLGYQALITPDRQFWADIQSWVQGNILKWCPRFEPCRYLQKMS